jgi:hypothetical protein
MVAIRGRRRAATGLPAVRVLSLQLDGSALFAGTSNAGVYRSLDGGETWAPRGLESVGVSGFGIRAAGPHALYAATDKGVFRTTDSGSLWLGIGLIDSPLSGIAVDATTPDAVYASHNGNGVFQSLDAGATWAVRNQGLTNRTVRVVASASAPDQALYAARGPRHVPTVDGAAADHYDDFYDVEHEHLEADDVLHVVLDDDVRPDAHHECSADDDDHVLVHDDDADVVFDHHERGHAHIDVVFDDRPFDDVHQPRQHDDVHAGGETRRAPEPTTTRSCACSSLCRRCPTSVPPGYRVRCSAESAMRPNW